MDLPRPGSLADAGAGSTFRPRGGPVKQLANVLRFGLPYLKRYLSRFTLGVVLGILFGASNVAFLWATDTLIKRMSVQTPALTAPGSVAGGSPAAPADRGLLSGGWRNRVQADLDAAVDPWLPRLGRSLDWRQVLGGLLLFPLLGAARGFIGYGSSYSMAWVSERVVNDLRVDVFQKISSLSMAFFNKSRVGDLITRVNGDTAALQKCLSLGVSDLIKEPVTVVSIVVGLFLIDWQLTLGVTVFFPLCVLPVIILGKKVRRAGKSGLAATISQSSLLVEMLEGIRVVKAFGLEGNQVERFRTLSREWIHHAMKGVRAKELVNPLIETISLLGFGILIVYIAARQISFSDMMVFLTGMAFIYTPVKKLAGLHVHFQQASVGVDRLVQILEEQPSVREPERPVPCGEFRQGLRFASIDFAYEQQQVLDRFTLEIPRGRKLGIAGESGSGKSTLVNLLFRFYDPTGGRIEMDGTDIRNFSLADLRSRMALVSQDVVLFDLTIAGNIACGRPGATREQIEAAAKAASAHEFILNLPQGYETRIGERGVTLSGGQRQRIAIARAFVRDAPILVLDEATAALDAHSEAEVQGAIQRLSENRTVICVAHRLSTLASMDRIIVLARGRIAEEGSFQELLAGGGLFTALAAAQQIRTPAGDGANGQPTTTP